MRHATQIVPESDQERFVHRFDLKEIDAPNERSFWRLLYVWRLQQVLALVSKLVPPGSRILEIGCAQGNVSLTLAEAGYDVTGVDLKPGFISYARKKDDRNLVRWVSGDAFELGESERFSAVVMPEVIEHVTAPADLVRKTFRLLDPGGLIVLTTPSGHCLANSLPTFEGARQSTNNFAGISIGPAGEDHIFAFTMPEMRSIIAQAGGDILAARLTGSVLLNTHVQWLLDAPLIGPACFAAVKVVTAMPLLDRLLAPTLLLAARPTARTER